MAAYTKLQLHALFDIERRNREYSYILAKSIKIKNEVLEEAKKGYYKYSWTSDDLITQRLLVELCKKLQSIFVDSKITTRSMGIDIDWT
jgi:hypothetical protein